MGPNNFQFAKHLKAHLALVLAGDPEPEESRFRLSPTEIVVDIVPVHEVEVFEIVQTEWKFTKPVWSDRQRLNVQLLPEPGAVPSWMKYSTDVQLVNVGTAAPLSPPTEALSTSSIPQL